MQANFNSSFTVKIIVQSLRPESLCITGDVHCTPLVNGYTNEVLLSDVLNL